jgi:hypothetical protein
MAKENKIKLFLPSCQIDRLFNFFILNPCLKSRSKDSLNYHISVHDFVADLATICSRFGDISPFALTFRQKLFGIIFEKVVFERPADTIQ